MVSSLQDHMRTKHKRIRLIMHLIYKGSARLLVMRNQVGTRADNSVFRMIIQMHYPSIILSLDPQSSHLSETYMIIGVPWS